MSDEHNNTGVQPDSSYREQINQPTRPIDPAQAAADTREDKRWFVPGQATQPFSGHAEDTQTFFPTTPSDASLSVPHADHTAPAPMPVSSTSSPIPVVTRVLPSRTRPLQGGTATQVPLAPVPQPGSRLAAPPGVAQRSRPAGKRDFRLLWLAGGLVLIVILSIAFVSISLSLSPHTQVAPGNTQPAGVPGASVPVADGLSVAPNHFTSSTCVVDNGYRCTATLFYGKLGAGPQNWTAYGTNVATKFSPASGVIAPGQQQQVIIYMLTPCSNNGDFVFLNTSSNTKLLVPWSC